MAKINPHKIYISDPRRLNGEDVEYDKLIHVYNRQEMADRLELLFATKHEIEFAASHRALTDYDVEKFTSATTEIESILSELLRDFREE